MTEKEWQCGTLAASSEMEDALTTHIVATVSLLGIVANCAAVAVILFSSAVEKNRNGIKYR